MLVHSSSLQKITIPWIKDVFKFWRLNNYYVCSEIPPSIVDGFDKYLVIYEDIQLVFTFKMEKKVVHQNKIQNNKKQRITKYRSRIDK